MLQFLDDEEYMRLALKMAEQCQGQTGINPAVGCVLVKDGRIVGLGAHLERGGPHAEINALNMAGEKAAGSTVYVTLEPCSHFGKTPPCGERLIREKVKRVVIARLDPNPLVSGKGIALLQKAGVEVKTGVLEQEAKYLNEAFEKYIRTKKPFVTLKTASTLDGKIASSTGDSKWISGEQAREYVHVLRHKHQAVMVGINTVIADNPRLSTRLTVPGLQPIRIVVDSALKIPETAAVICERIARTIIVTTSLAPAEKMERLKAMGAEFVVCGAGPHVDLPLAMERLGEMEIGSILLEGGGKLNGSMLAQGLVDKMVLFFAPKLIGGAQSPPNFVFPGFARMDEAIRLKNMRVETIGEDICITGYPALPGERRNKRDERQVRDERREAADVYRNN
ncbi:MAG TPA: bifunctional diaminohydroxyphosphoribosylaminopyrimidine deaminase/5-amino-6-(5-phosphoribosylamino)uracil reductase RibD [Bacilli bacterium]